MDDDSIGNRLKRYAVVSGKLSQVALKLAKYYYMDSDSDGQKQAEELKAALGDLKGPLMKVAQLLATVPDLLPPAFAAELMQLQSLAPAMHGPFVKRRMRGELGDDWESKFTSFDKEAIAAASLGQVHRAVTLDGRDVACKLQYPDMISVVKADLAQLRLFLKAMDAYGGALQSDDIVEEIQDRLFEELSYYQEAENIHLFQGIYQNYPFVSVPQVIDDLSTDRLLTMTWLEGEPLLEYRTRSLEDRNILARHMFDAWYIPFYHHGVIHGDPHLGNYRVRDDLGVHILDFGCIRKFSPAFVEGVIDLYHALYRNDDELAAHAYQKWGFTHMSKELMDVLNHWARFLYGPIMEDRVRPIDETRSGVYGREVAAQVHQELRRVGGVKPPKEFVFMDRAAIGLGSVFLHLGAEINWYEAFHQILDSRPQIDMK